MSPSGCDFGRPWSPVLGAIALLAVAACAGGQGRTTSPTAGGARRPNILIAISDDQSHGDLGAYGAQGLRTPAIDRLAREGVLFRSAFHASPGCSPSRASLLTGRHTWQLEEAGTHASSFPTKYLTYPDLLERAGYFIGLTGKGWGPGDYRVSGRTRNPAGPAFDAHRRSVGPKTSDLDYAANFRAFLEAKPAGAPFHFWYGAYEPHRDYQPGRGLASGKRLADAKVPSFLPDTEEVRSDLLDYYEEIEHFDRHLGEMLAVLEARGELENTILIVTSDNGMPFPRAKANCYELGIHAPLIIRWGAAVKPGRVIEDLVGLVDLAPTLLEAASVPRDQQMSGRSFLDALVSGKSGLVDARRNRAYAARERHSSSRYRNWSYPVRAMRTPEYLLLRNFRPDRWPAGDPAGVGGVRYGYYDIDEGPTKALLWERRDDPGIGRFFELAVAKRPAFELFDVRRDPENLRNLAGDPRHSEVLARLSAELDSFLRATGDFRVLDGGEIWETYQRYSPLREFPPPP